MPIVYTTHLAKSQDNFSECPECKSATLYHYRWGKQDNVRCAACNFPTCQSGDYDWDVPSDGEPPQMALGSYPPNQTTGDHIPVGPGNKTGIIGRDPNVRMFQGRPDLDPETFILRKKP
jgi:hypothetical protein